MRFPRRLALALLAAAAVSAQQPPPLVSPEVSPDRKVTFRLLAPKADSVKVMGGDMPGNGPGTAMTKGENGVWEATVGPLPGGAYRYNFNVAGLTLLDPRNPANSESNNNVWSMVVVPGDDRFDTKQVPHGAVAAVTYYSTELKRHRRMTIYTPPGYENGKEKYPVFFLLHGASDSDHSWSSVGRAGVILDNLIAEKKAKPMIMVMPAGHTNAGGFRVPGAADEFAKDFVTDIMPYVDKHYRVQTGRAHRAIAGLSMGGNQTLAVGIPHLDKFAYLGVFSSGLIGEFGPTRPGAPARPAGPSFEERHKAELDNPALKKGLKLVWFGIGKEDFLLKTAEGTVALLKKHGFDVTYKETAGGHTWLNWRDYLAEFAPKLFQ
jgi:enterochelin esterase family protein